jgi:hemoglobin
VNEAPLFERLGGREGVTAVVEKAVANHFANPVVSTRFAHASQSVDTLVSHAVEFFCTGLSGVETYSGRPLATAHAGMNVTEQEFMAVLDDILDAMNAVGIGQQEQAEVLAILYGMKGDVVRI